jgi:acetylornithine deacetylase
MNKLNIELNKWLEKNKDTILENLSQLIQIKTVNTPPTGNEKPGQEFLYNLISKFIPDEDIDIFEVDDVKNVREHPLFESKIDGIERIYKNRPNLVAKIKGTSNGRSLVFSGHMDTVKVFEDKWDVFDDPFSGKIKDGKIYGRGVLDMKGGLICGFFALKCLKDLGIKLKGDVYSESVVDEELGGVNGTIACRLRYPDIDFAILSEPTNLTVAIESRGGSVWKAIVNEAGPGGYSQSGNPIHQLSELVLLLEEYDKYRNKNIILPDDFVGEKIYKLLIFEFFAGGRNYIENASYIPKNGHIYFFIPTIPHTPEKELWADFMNFLNSKINTCKYLDKSLLSFEKTLRYFKGYRSDINHPAFESIRKAYKDIELPYLENHPFMVCDAEAFKEVSNTELAIIGLVGDKFHGIDENVEIESIFNLIKIMVLTAVDFCN